MTHRKQNLLYLIVSFVFAIFLFLYATNTNYQKTASSGEVYTNTISSVAINIQYDNEKYFASGFTPDVTVQLTSSNRLTLQREGQEATRSFSVVADLSSIESGTHEVPLKVENVPSGVTATLSPETINVTIDKRATKTFKVETQVDSNQVDEGLTISSVSTEDTEVEVVTDKGTLAKIARVVAILPADVTLSDNYSEKVTLQAVDAEGNFLPSIITPEETNLIIKVKKS